MHKVVWIIVGLSALLTGLWLGWPATKVPATPAPLAQVVPVAAKPATPAKLKPLAAPTITVTERLPEPVSRSFKLIASAYAAELEYPAYARPLYADDNHLLNPNHYIVQSVPLTGGASAAIVLDKYRFSYPEPVTVSLQVSGLQVNDVSVQLHSEQNNQLLGSETMLSVALQSDATQNAGQHWQAELNPEVDWDGPLQVSVSFSSNGKQQTLKTGIVYSYPVATITGVGASRGAGSDMLIPVHIDVKKAGYYRLRANLFTAARQPLAHLSVTEKLAEGEGKLMLRAYKGVLRQQEGPFILSSFILEKRSAVPGELTRYGDSEQSEYLLEYFSLSQLTDEPWQASAEEQQRLQFLQQMAEQ
ncbi:hypothetical protein VT06_02035 [Arsukibacterium sp. MJ3]|uniref:hypothetical protein n=1 Tax=Arsukibacterium sp. MJ3 TaxID=1632859 RepID=UPI0006273B65|nr:hypothetical protein [Arsukibacterium sp. MJ3]KKO50254.1 hypothetical protein VT06_02035 [Arsukibacterium sp. MJ3]